MYLLDTNVVSELRRSRPKPRVVAWVGTAPEANLHLSAVTLGELQRGAEMLRARDPARADALEAWVDGLAETFAILPADAAIFRLHARLMHRQPTPSFEDALIAATAIVNGLTVVTRNARDFEGCGVKVFDPFGG